MTDHVTEQRIIPNHTDEELNSSTESDSDLRFPQLLLQACFDSLLTHSYPSTSSTLVSMEHYHKPSALEESWTSLEDVEYMNDEDLQSETTDAGSLIDVHVPEDVRSTHDGESSSGSEQGNDDEVDDQVHEDVSSNVAVAGSEDLPIRQHDRPVITTRLVDDDDLILQESEVPPMASHVTVDHILKVFSPSEVSRMKLKTIPHARCFGTIHMNLSNSTLDSAGRRSFRLLLFGKEYTPQLRKTLLEKFGDVLIAGGALSNSTSSDTPSRYHVVPDSFGPGSRPTSSEIIPIEWQLEVEQYHSLIRHDNSQDIMISTDKPPKRIEHVFRWNGQNHHVDNDQFSRPDLAILCMDRNDGPEERHSTQNMILFARRHSFPIMILRMDNDWNARFDRTMFDDSQGYMCIETQSVSGRYTIQSLPIDINTFLSLNSSQLNRHVAYLIDNWAPKTGITSKRVKNVEPGDKTTEVKTNAIFWTKPHVLQQKYLLSGRLILYLVSALLAAAAISFGVNACNSLFSHLAKPITNAINASSVSIGGNMNTVMASSTPSVTATPSTLLEQLTTPSTPSNSIQTSDYFEVNVADNSHLLVKAPIGPKTVRGKVNLQISVHRGKQPIEFEFQHHFDSIYNIRIDPKEAYGDLEVSLVMRRPAVSEVVIVSLGARQQEDRSNFLFWADKQVNHTWAVLGRTLKQIQTYSSKASYLLKQRGTWMRLFTKEKMLSTLQQDAQQLIGRLQETMSGSDAIKRDLYNMISRLRVDTGEVIAKFTNSAHSSRVRGQAQIQDISNQVQKIAETFKSLKGRIKIEYLSELMQDHARSEQLATAQDRAHQLITNMKYSLKARLGGR